MSLLTEILAHEISRRGPISFREFMELALYHPEHGYYASGRARIGCGGDFFTSVSVGPLFGRLLARQFSEMWERLGRPASFDLVEQGAHGGEFAHDALSGLCQVAPACYEAVRYTIVEPFPVLEARQRQQLGEFGSRVRWADNLDVVASIDGIHFSNELLDAFPVHRVRWTRQGWQECGVAWQESRFVWAEVPLTTNALSERLRALPPDLPAGYTTEVNLAALEWMDCVASRLRRGWVLLIDYGYPRTEYYRSERFAGTLSAYAQHQRVNDPLSSPGEVDLTAHVEFSSISERAVAAGLQPCGFTDQHHFMVGLSRLHFTDTAEPTPEHARDLRAFKSLMHPNLLGHAFHALCFARGVATTPSLAGFDFARAVAP